MHTFLSWSDNSISPKKRFATARSASSGQAFSKKRNFKTDNNEYSQFTWNQSIVQQLTIAGNFLILFLKLSPMGLIVKTTCNCSLTICTKKLNNATGLPSVCIDLSRCLSNCRIFSHNSAFSSPVNKFGTSPEFNKLLISSRNDSSLIWVSQNRKTPCWSEELAFRKMTLTSSRHS